ncbi:MAG: sigma 54-interacting transcriptional regulator [Myxococcota bacterium]
MQSTLTEGFSAGPSGGKTAASLFRVLDADRPCGPGARVSLEGVDEVLLGRADRHQVLKLEANGSRVLKLGVADRWMSGQHARLSRVMRAWVLEDTKSKNGVRRNGEPTQRAELADGDVLELGRTFFVFRLEQPVAPDLSSDELRPAAPGLATLSPTLAAQFDELARLARSAVTISLGGPSGSGKEVIARAVHALSGRPGPFVAVNCGALPDELVESELFGHRKGAFSGATDDRPGLVRAAHGGTLFLDEVGDLPLEAQPALLRVLQEKQVQPVGATSPVPVDLRVLSATHRSLEALSAQGLFRDDLRARLSGYQLSLPPLAARREDLGILCAALVSKLAPSRASTLQLGIQAARALFSWDWPLNVRELEKTLEAALVLSGSGPIELEHLPPALRSPPPPKRSAPEDEGVDEARKAELISLLQQHAGNVSAVARAMGKARMQIQRWMARYQLDPRTFRS